MSDDVSTKISRAVINATAAQSRLSVVAALNCIDPADLAPFFHLSLAEGTNVEPVGEGLPASPGAATGTIVLSAEAALAAAESGRSVILVRPETAPDDTVGMQVSAGILTTRGGLVSHAAVVARGWGIPAVVGAAEIEVDLQKRTVTAGDVVWQEGERVTIDGSTGKIYTGELATTSAEPPAELETLLGWADAVADGHVQVRVNADTEGDAGHGRDLGAQGIGLCRTEHMFLSDHRLPIMRRFILADNPEAEEAALAELEAAQTHDFEQVLAAMDTRPVTVRLLDPPLHEFLPDLTDLSAKEAAGTLNESERTELQAARLLHETNPMIGTRGVRLGIVRSGLYQMQVRALCQAATTLFEQGRQPVVEIMIPLVVDAEELRIVRSWVAEVLDDLGHPELSSSVITIGAMIETPRAALTAGALAKHADFFSFGTNDLTQMTYAFSRDDVESRLLPAYQRLGILPANPFAVLDQDGVGELVRIGCETARAAKPSIRLGACGEHAGHPESAAFLVRLGVDSVSCSPFRVPMARLGVAQALLACGRVHVDEIVIDFNTAPASSEVDGTDISATRVGEAVDMSADGSTAIDVDESLILHVLRIRGFVTPDGFTESIGAHPTDMLADLIGTEHVRHLEARDMFSLTPAGRERYDALLPAIANDGVKAGLGAHYEPFLELNSRFKELCTLWQVRNGEPNDHADADYDQVCVTRLAELHAATMPVLGAMATALPRLVRYQQRLAAAEAEVAAGQTKRFTGVMCESYHDIWMELHEDLIVLQGIDRAAEGSF
jgi:phosphoenolpyruvate-protein kinase (PTS system EI component)